MTEQLKQLQALSETVGLEQPYKGLAQFELTQFIKEGNI